MKYLSFECFILLSLMSILSCLELGGYELIYRLSEYLNQVDTYKHSQLETVLRSDY